MVWNCFSTGNVIDWVYGSCGLGKSLSTVDSQSQPVAHSLERELTGAARHKSSPRAGKNREEAPRNHINDFTGRHDDGGRLVAVNRGGGDILVRTTC
jgi:hypothetical protein